ncbi:PREDICTED: mitochondrial ubiquitin ligase activator of nfkb 1-A [Papilio polytes]|uniref:mitochondrial ubiquitin ligase activator of nfkb 1-A n=1 Tax=Papilio polytes TaxID=76194 RepID=UPI000675D33D|nr:PREDICTED: mitochondrial ubiquitin ligase activator of nfkb 1-A [Papilio polytes]
MDFFSEIIGETVVLGIDSLILGFCVKQLSKCKHILNALQTAPILDIDSTLNKEINKYSDQVIPYVVIRGLVKPLGNPIVSNYNNTVTGVIQRLTIKEHVIARTSAGFWSDQTRTIHEVYNSTPFVLSNGKYSIEVIDALAAELLDLDVISDKFEPMSPGVIDHVWGFFSGVRQRGLQTMEEMLRDGSYITAIGELSRTQTGALKLQPPRDGLPLYLTTATKSSLLKRLASSRDFLRILLVVFGAVAVLASGRVAYKYLKRRKRRQLEESLKRQLAAGRKERRAHAREKNLTDVQLCVVCSENPKEIILLPCGHVCLCEDCSENIKDNCPICRERIEARAPAFIT